MESVCTHRSICLSPPFCSLRFPVLPALTALVVAAVGVHLNEGKHFAKNVAHRDTGFGACREYCRRRGGVTFVFAAGLLPPGLQLSRFVFCGIWYWLLAHRFYGGSVTLKSVGVADCAPL